MIQFICKIKNSDITAILWRKGEYQYAVSSSHQVRDEFVELWQKEGSLEDVMADLNKRGFTEVV